MLQPDNFPADGSIITGLPNGVWARKNNEEDDTQVFKFLNKPALLKSFQEKVFHYRLIRQPNNKTVSKQSYYLKSSVKGKQCGLELS